MSPLRRTHGRVGAQRVHVEGLGGQRGHHVDHEQRRVVGGVDRRAQGRQIAGDAAGGVGVHHEDGGNLMRAVIAQCLRHRGGIDRPALVPGRAHDAAAQGLGLDGPGFREMPGARHQRRAARRNQVLHHRFPHPVAVGSVEEDVGGFGLQQAFQAVFAGRDDGIHARVAHVHGLPAHGVQHLVGHRRGAGRVQKAAAGDARWCRHARIVSRRPVGRRRPRVATDAAAPASTPVGLPLLDESLHPFQRRFVHHVAGHRASRVRVRGLDALFELAVEQGLA